MNIEQTEKYFHENKVESNLQIKQPWVLWREKTSTISLDEISKRMKEINENTNDD